MLNVSLCVREARCIKFFGKRRSVGGLDGWDGQKKSFQTTSTVVTSVVFPAAQYNMLLAPNVMLM